MDARVTSDEGDEVGAIHLVVHGDGRVEFSLTGVFQNHPELLADLVEQVKNASS